MALMPVKFPALGASVLVLPVFVAVAAMSPAIASVVLLTFVKWLLHPSDHSHTDAFCARENGISLLNGAIRFAKAADVSCASALRI